jgi:hypothetical protein
MKTKPTVIQIHNFLNGLYEKSDAVAAALKRKGLSCKVGSYAGHYITVGKGHALGRYFIPVITVIGCGDIGVNFDGIFFEVARAKGTVSEGQIKKALKNFPQAEIYGWKDCLWDFYRAGDSAEVVMAKIKSSRERRVQFGFNLELKNSPAAIVKAFLKFYNALS